MAALLGKHELGGVPGQLRDSEETSKMDGQLHPASGRSAEPEIVSVANATSETTTGDSDSAVCIPLPNEILNLVAAECKEFEPEVRQRTWLACSLASRQLRDIVLPHLFSGIRVVLRARNRTLPEYTGFMATTPWIAHHVRHISIMNSTVIMTELVSLLKHLPSLQDISMRPISIVQGDTSTSTTHHNLAIGHLMLDFTGTHVSPLVLCTDVLALFLDVESLEIYSGRFSNMIGDQSHTLEATAAAAKTPQQKRKLKNLSLHCWGVTSIFTTFLLGINALSHLTSLNYDVPSNGFRQLGDLLHTIGATLLSLRIIASVGSQMNGQAAGIGTLPPGFRSSLATCTSLEEFRLCLYGQSTSPEESLAISDCWIFATFVISVLPTNYLAILGLKLAMLGETTNNDVHSSIPWDAMRRALHRFTHIRVIDFEAFASTDINRCIAYELRQFKGALNILEGGRCKRYEEEQNGGRPSSALPRRMPVTLTELAQSYGAAQ
ncbi:hypothetical protein BC629DRAFT_1439386 [Irpex lacteus]|nr:hypothetical protein BC629DRAFT_1439386 [Irpex lacteus]